MKMPKKFNLPARNFYGYMYAQIAHASSQRLSNDTTSSAISKNQQDWKKLPLWL